MDLFLDVVYKILCHMKLDIYFALLLEFSEMNFSWFGHNALMLEAHSVLEALLVCPGSIVPSTMTLILEA
jgi:hypothetical protein